MGRAGAQRTCGPSFAGTGTARTMGQEVSAAMKCQRSTARRRPARGNRESANGDTEPGDDRCALGHGAPPRWQHDTSKAGNKHGSLVDPGSIRGRPRVDELQTVANTGEELGYSLFRWEDPWGESDDALMAECCARKRFLGDPLPDRPRRPLRALRARRRAAASRGAWRAVPGRGAREDRYPRRGYVRIGGRPAATLVRPGLGGARPRQQVHHRRRTALPETACAAVAFVRTQPDVEGADTSDAAAVDNEEGDVDGIFETAAEDGYASSAGTGTAPVLPARSKPSSAKADWGRAGVDFGVELHLRSVWWE